MNVVSYGMFMKHAEKVTKSAGSARPILTGVYHSPEGYVAVTDSHRLYLAEGIYEGGEKTENPKTGESIDGNYPQLKNIISDDDHAKASAVISGFSEVSGIAKATRVIQQCAMIPKCISDKPQPKAKTTARIYTEGKDVFYTTPDNCGIPAKVQIGVASENTDEINLYVNSENLSQALEVFKDAGISEVTLRIFGNLSPFTIKGGNLTVVISPIRNVHS